MRGKPLNDETVAERLLVDYPDKVIRDLNVRYRSNNTILQYLKRKAKRAGVTVEVYLKRLGFEFIPERDMTPFIERLLNRYPDKVIRDNLTSLSFYSSINNTAYSLKVKPVALLRALGFRIQKERRSTIC
jgi:hypothetical protein